MKTSSLVSILAIFLASCGGGGDSREHVQTAVQCIVHVEVFGDSIMCGRDGGKTAPAACGLPGGEVGMVATPPPVLLQRYLDSVFGAGAVVVHGHGIGGTTAAQFASGADGVNAAWPQSVPAGTDIVLWNYGVNEARLGVSVSQYKATVSAMLEVSPARAMILTPTQTLNSWPVGDYAQAAKEVAAAHSVPVVDSYALPWWTGVLVDGVHPVQAGYDRLVSEAIGPQLTGMVQGSLAMKGCM